MKYLSKNLFTFLYVASLKMKNWWQYEDGPGGGGGWQYEDGLRVTFEEMHFSLEREMLE